MSDFLINPTSNLNNFIDFEKIDFEECSVDHIFYSKLGYNLYITIQVGGLSKEVASKYPSAFVLYVIECLSIQNLSVIEFPSGVSRIDFSNSKKDQKTQTMSIFDLNQNFGSEKGWITVEAEKFNLINLGVFDWLTYKLSNIPFLIEKLDRPTGLDMQQ